MTTVISHYSALRAIRRGRRVYSVLPWEPVSAEDQSQILANAVPGKAKVDLEELLILDAWDKDSDPVDLLLSSSANRRVCPHAVQHVLSPKLPPGSIRHVKADIYATSPAFTALLCSKGASVAKTLMLLMELLGAYSLPPETTPFIRYDEIWPHREQDALGPVPGQMGSMRIRAWTTRSNTPQNPLRKPSSQHASRPTIPASRPQRSRNSKQLRPMQGAAPMPISERP